LKLTQSRLEQFDQDGYLFFPALFSPAEIKVLADAVPGLYAQRRPENVREKTGDVVRTNFAAHLYSLPFAKLARHPRMVRPIEAIFGEKVYMHQFKINGKAAFDGDVWQWHQDYGTWKNDDWMPEARAMNVAIFLDEVNEFNGPLRTTTCRCRGRTVRRPRSCAGCSTRRETNGAGVKSSGAQGRKPEPPSKPATISTCEGRAVRTGRRGCALLIFNLRTSHGTVER
jgi:hypothetical protein